eukprot:jgi/Botrbrau1/6351/Bobra.0098s0010.1
MKWKFVLGYLLCLTGPVQQTVRASGPVGKWPDPAGSSIRRWLKPQSTMPCAKPWGILTTNPPSGWCNSTAMDSAAADRLEIKDTGNGTARYEAVIGQRTLKGVLNPSLPAQPLYGRSCTVLHVRSVVIWFQRGDASLRDPPDPNAMTAWLTLLGLNSTQVITGSLIVYVDHAINPITIPYRPVFFSNLSMVANLTVAECANCALDPLKPPAVSWLQNLAGLEKLTRFWFWTSSSSSALIMRGTRLLTFLPLKNLACSPGQLVVADNPQLLTLMPLPQLPPLPLGAPAVQITNNPKLGSSAIGIVLALSPLASLAGCNNGSSSLASSVLIQTPNCTIVCWAQYCRFIAPQTAKDCGTCPAPPPPSPSPPPRPPSPAHHLLPPPRVRLPPPPLLRDQGPLHLDPRHALLPARRPPNRRPPNLRPLGAHLLEGVRPLNPLLHHHAHLLRPLLSLRPHLIKLYRAPCL